MSWIVIKTEVSIVPTSLRLISIRVRSQMSQNIFDHIDVDSTPIIWIFTAQLNIINYTNFKDSVNQHFFRFFGSPPFLITTVNANLSDSFSLYNKLFDVTTIRFYRSSTCPRHDCCNSQFIRPSLDFEKLGICLQPVSFGLLIAACSLVSRESSLIDLWPAQVDVRTRIATILEYSNSSKFDPSRDSDKWKGEAGAKC